MGKITNYSGQPQYLQILNLANRSKIQSLSTQNGYDRYVKKLGLPGKPHQNNKPFADGYLRRITIACFCVLMMLLCFVIII